PAPAAECPPRSHPAAPSPKADTAAASAPDTPFHRPPSPPHPPDIPARRTSPAAIPGSADPIRQSESVKLSLPPPPPPSAAQPSALPPPQPKGAPCTPGYPHTTAYPVSFPFLANPFDMFLAFAAKCSALLTA